MSMTAPDHPIGMRHLAPRVETPLRADPVSLRLLILLTLCCWLVGCAMLILKDNGQIGRLFSDTDDQMRFISLREWLAGKSWYDMTIARVFPPEGLSLHWARWIDAGIGSLILLFKPFTGTALAERIALAIWPLAWLLAATGIAVAFATRMAGRRAGLVALLFILPGIPGYEQFTLGRIDHHNVQLTLTLGALTAMAYADRTSWCGPLAGILLAASLSAGLEGLLILALASLVFAWHAWRHETAFVQFSRFALAFGVAIVPAYLVNQPLALWRMPACDALAGNLAAPLLFAGLMLGPGSRMIAKENATARLILILLAGGGAAAIFLAMEPRCLKGVFGLIDPAIRPIWLDKVTEAQPMLAKLREEPVQAMALLAFPLAAMMAGLWLMFKSPEATPGLPFALAGLPFALAGLLGALVMMLLMVRATSYGVWFGLAPMAAAVVALWRRLRLEGLATRSIAAVLLMPLSLSLLALSIGQAMFEEVIENKSVKNACFDTRVYTRLASLPRGLVLAPIDLGPAILLNTPHQVMAAPYHRQGRGIIANHATLNAAPDEARDLAGKHGVTYVVLCRPDKQPSPSVSLINSLARGIAPSWLSPITSGDSPLLIYRVGS
jgi:hypothetical protein